MCRTIYTNFPRVLKFEMGGREKNEEKCCCDNEMIVRGVESIEMVSGIVFCCYS